MTDVFITSYGMEIPIVIKKRRGARNITLRPKNTPRREIHIGLPMLSSVATGLKFIEQKRAWVENIFMRAPEKIKIKSGDTINFLGREVLIKHDATVRSNFYLGDALIVGGAQEMLESRIREFIKKELLITIKEIIKTVPDEFHPARITFRDTTSRWGSRSSSGTIAFSWRLALAPVDVMRYVVMHELAHTKHMDHSPAFWATVAKLHGDGVVRAKLWLSKNGQSLHRYF